MPAPHHHQRAPMFRQNLRSNHGGGAFVAKGKKRLKLVGRVNSAPIDRWIGGQDALRMRRRPSVTITNYVDERFPSRVGFAPKDLRCFSPNDPNLLFGHLPACDVSIQNGLISRV
ncbi:MAG: hypothetical protein WA431_03575, partial [Candidatus Cybelea sp.]